MRLLCLLLWLPVAAQSAILSEFSCVRPKPLDPGSWHNVTVTAAVMNGVVVRPGEQFSFLEALTPAQANLTYGHSLSAGRVVRSKGGGYCQISAAIYNAALLAGFPVSERYSHSFYYSSEAYVEPGRDAAVSGSSQADFRFENSSAVPLTLEVIAQDGKVTAKILGALSPKRRWVTTTAKQIPYSRFKRKSREEAGKLLRPGFDGWEVARELSVLDSKGNTRTVNLGVDRYEMIPELVAEPEVKPLQ